MKVIEAEWQRYRSQVIPLNASQAQVIETRRAFYAGAVALHYKLRCITSSDISVAEEDVQLLTDVSNEVSEYERELDKAAQP